MATIGTRINENGEKEIIITKICRLNDLIDVINNFRKRDLFGEKIFIVEDVVFLEENIDRKINFFDCIFEKTTKFIDITFNEEVNFNHSIFQSDTSFIDVKFHKQSDFRGVEFQKHIEFQHIKFVEYADFSNANFQSKTEFNYINFQEGGSFDEIHFQGETSFLEVIFKQNTGFWNTNFQNTVEFNEVDFQDGFSFEDINFQGETYFSEVRFKGRGIFGDINFQDIAKFQTCKFYNSTFENAIFNKSVDFSSSTFQFPQTFYSVSFMDTANFSNTTFEQEAQFTSCKVDSKTLISFQCATFKKGLDISTSNFNLCKLNFLGIKIENINEALSSEFYDDKRDDTKPFLSIHHRLRETFRFIKNSLYAENNQIEGLEFHKKEMEVYEKELKLKLRNAKTEKKEGKTNPLWIDIGFAIFCILLLMVYLYWCYIFYWGLVGSMLAYFWITKKNSNITKESIIKSLSKNPIVYGTVWLLAIAYILCFFYTLHEYREEANKLAWIIFICGIFAPLLLFSDLTKDNIILFLNKHSNDFGTNWVNGIAFTFLCGIITFILMAIFSNLDFSFSYEGVNNFISSIIKIVNLVDTKPFEIKDNAHLKTKNSVSSLFSEMNIPTYITLFIGRIFIGYGYYQTIQAFRKYGK